MANATTDSRGILIHEIYRALLNDELDPTLYHVIFKCLSIQSALGLKGSHTARDRSSIVPWVTMNLRQSLSFFIQIYKDIRIIDPCTVPHLSQPPPFSDRDTKLTR